MQDKHTHAPSYSQPAPCQSSIKIIASKLNDITIGPGENILDIYWIGPPVQFLHTELAIASQVANSKVGSANSVTRVEMYEDALMYLHGELHRPSIP